MRRIHAHTRKGTSLQENFMAYARASTGAGRPAAEPLDVARRSAVNRKKSRWSNRLRASLTASPPNAERTCAQHAQVLQDLSVIVRLTRAGCASQARPS